VVVRRALILVLLACLGVPAAARAAAPSEPATPPTPGALYRDGQTARYLLGGQWLYRADPGNLGLTQGWYRNHPGTAGWRTVSVPNAFNAGDFSNASMVGAIGWYRRDFTVPAGAFAGYVPAAARRWIVRFESVNYRATVWLNGRRIGYHVGAYLPFEVDLGRLRQGVNRLVVRVDSRHNATDLPPGPGGGWWNFGGILREVYLRAVQEADISQVQIRTPLSCPTCAAVIQEQVTVRNPTRTTQRVSLTGQYGPVSLTFGTARIAPGQTWSASATAVLPHPTLWAPGSPHLYRATLTLSDAQGRRLQGYVDYSGIRSIVVTSTGRIALNGRLLDVRGVSLHEQDIGEGAAIDPAHLRRLFGWVKQIGATMIRAHYPLNPELEEMADRAGVLVWSEIPVYMTQSQYLDQPAWSTFADSVLRTNILTNQNHPSILLWSIANELETPAPASEADYIAGAAALARQLDPTRPVGMAISAWPGVACQTAYAPLDVIGYNDYFGWYDAGGGSTDDRDQLSPFLDALRSCYPSKAMFVTEFGFEANRNGPVEVRGTYQFQADSAAFHLHVFATKHWLSGALYFALQDFAVNPGWTGGNPRPDPPFLTKGLIGLHGYIKPAFAVVSAIFHATRQIAPAPRRGAAGARRGL
jgi:beta-glucuronidase